MTGFDIESDDRVELPPADGSEPDEFEKEFLDEAILPDAEKAESQWREVKLEYESLIRDRSDFDLAETVFNSVFRRCTRISNRSPTSRLASGSFFSTNLFVTP